MIQQMNAREKTLATIVGVLLVSLITYLLLSWFLTNHTKLKNQLRDRRAELAAMKTLSTERELWLQRDAYFREKQPPLSNPQSAGVELMDETKEIAKNHSIVIENPLFGSPEVRPNYQAVTISLETKSKWEDLVEFIYEMQAPNNFIVFESAKLTLDQGDKTQVRGNFRLAKWFAPK
jgi:hypothetical protein